jgi:glycyl-tRNA synthetase beta chain
VAPEVRQDLLFEIGTEELPAGVPGPTAERLGGDLAASLAEARLEPGRVRTAVTPRRLAIHVEGLLDAQPDREVTFTGPKESVGLDADGRPTKAALGFLRGKGARPEDLEIVDGPKGRVCAVTRLERGRPAVEVVAEVLAEVTGKLRFPKSMRWPGSPIAFSRPVRTVTALLGDTVVPVELAGIPGGREVRGHPFLSPDPIELPDADFDRYVELLAEAKVQVSRETRRDRIRAEVETLSREAGGVGEADAELLEEVADLVEWPGAAVGSFDAEFLEVPREVLATAMKVHQRYFPVTGEDGALRARFVVVHNRGEAAAPDILEGNERVLRARLADARFFWIQDRKTTLESRREELGEVLFHRELGSLRDKSDRVAAIVEAIAPLGGAEGVAGSAGRAARLAKADLLTEMVGEFPELQGVMGGHYARSDGETEEVAEAIEAQYFPRRQGEPLPAGRAAVLLTVAEKLDNLVSFFSIGKGPKGGGDPFGLRRQAVGLIRLLREGPLPLPLGPTVRAAAAHAPAAADDLADRVLAFVRERLRQALLDGGRRYDLVDAAMASGTDDLRDLDARLAALTALAGTPEWPDLVTVAERTHNIAKSVEGELPAPRADLLSEAAERSLHAALEEHGAAVGEALEARDYLRAASLYREAFAEPVHAFFDEVFVNVDDEAVRTNRLALCRAVNRALTARFADLAKVVMASG